MSISAQLAPLLTLSLLPLAAMAQTTGVMSFMNSHAGVVYEKDLGPNTDAVARAMTRFDPDESWRKASTP